MMDNATYLSFLKSLNTFLRIFEPFFLFPLIAIGLIGNLTSIMLFCMRRLKFEQSNCLIASLALSNSIFLVSLLIVSLSYLNLDLFNNYDLICKLNVYLTYLSSFLSVWIIAAFSIDRVRIVYFKNSRFKLRKWNKITLFILVISSAFIYSIVFSTTGVEKIKVKKPSNKIDINEDERYFTRSLCVTYKESMNIFKQFGMFDIILTALVPFIIISISNIAIIIRLKKFKKPILNDASTNYNYNTSNYFNSHPNNIVNRNSSICSSNSNNNHNHNYQNNNNNKLVKKEIPSSSPSKSAKTSAFKFYFDNETNRKYILNDENNEKFILNECCALNHSNNKNQSPLKMHGSNALLNKRYHNDESSVTTMFNERSKKFEIIEDKDSYTLINNLGFMYTVKKIKRSSIFKKKTSLINKLRNNNNNKNKGALSSNENCSTSHGSNKFEKHNKEINKSKKKSISVNFKAYNMNRRSCTSLNKAPPPSTATSYLMNRNNEKSSSFLHNTDSNSISIDKKSSYQSRNFNESIKLKRKQIYSKTTRTLLMISCVFLVLNTPMVINKMIQFYSSFTQGPTAVSSQTDMKLASNRITATMSMITTTTQKDVISVDETKNVFPLYDFHEQEENLMRYTYRKIVEDESARQSSKTRKKRSSYINRSNYLKKISTATKTSKPQINILGLAISIESSTTRNAKKVNVTSTASLIYNELLERISCYTYYLHISINCFFYLINFKKLRKIFCKFLSRRC